MPVNYRWISTDRRTDAEVLKEIAEADTPLVIISRDPLDEQTLQRLSETKFSSPTLFLDVSLDDIARKILASAGRIRRLIASPWQCLSITECRPNPEKRRVPLPASLYDWYLERTSCTPSVLSEGGCRPHSQRMLREPVRPALIAPSPKLSGFFREQIEQTFSSGFRAGNFNAIALKAGVWLWHDAMDESHACAQSIEGKGWKLSGDYWHAIMHRREPDYGNSKYWFRHVGAHPVFPELGKRAEPLIAEAAPEWKERLLHNGWDPFAFVDFCELAAGKSPPQWTELAERIQELEMLLLLASTYQDAVK